MFQLVRYDTVDRAAADAGPTMLRDRERYRIFYEVAERFAAEHRLIVAGPGAVRLVTVESNVDSAKLTPDDNRYDFYSARGFNQARELAECLYRADPDGLGRYTTLLTNVPQMHWIILVDMRRLFSITALPAFRGVGTADLVDTVDRPALFGPTRLSVIGPALALLDVYRALCDATELGNLQTLLESEETLRNMYLKQNGDAPKSDAPVPHAVQLLGKIMGRSRTAAPKAKPRRTVADLRDDLMRQFVTGPARVLLGRAALQLLLGDSATLSDWPIHLVTSNNLEAEADLIHKIAEAAHTVVRAHIDNPLLPGNHRLRRMTVLSGESDCVITVYNLASYELIPFFEVPWRGAKERGAKEHSTKEHSAVLPYRVGSVFAVMRCALIEEWFAKLFKEPRDSTYKEAARALELLKVAPGSEPFFGILTATSYIGRVEDAELALKREASEIPRRAANAALDQPKFFRPYMPAETDKFAKAKGEADKKGPDKGALGAHIVEQWDAYMDSYWGH